MVNHCPSEGRLNAEDGTLPVKQCKVSCEDCFFKRNGLCALMDEVPCTTFRPNHPDGLRPPTQMRFVFRQERRTRVVSQFPTAQEQVALHA
jgi:hypothetical protein